MSTIFYFSGTGNSLTTAKEISDKLQGKLIPIIQALSMENNHFEDIIGIVSPVYCMDLPKIVEDFLQNYKFKKQSYIFGIVTCAGADGLALNKMKTILDKRGFKLSYGNKVILPDNSIIFPTSNDKKMELLNNQQKVVNKIFTDISDRKTNSYEFKKSIRNQILSKGLKLGLNKIYKIQNKNINKEKCINCGTCEKLCPVSNINKTNGQYIIGKDCENCFACAHWCPQRAISIGKFAPNHKTHYTHPKITLKDILNRD
ncbi:ferredoxin [Clostridium homopropionicum DSM 5847]|uniref:Ferredoxin n=1 Tax=Clostridium homopropionicum DSM 5847 TaxID=1121318 RepID=A0A0L6Z9X9_9CLOT|nr:EFR1 family ferrodoxin [Clostridium homopropionicum]KOA19774.1 ferredoxin [Clostridium homopropionicum DSM 5847]SFF77798.1 Ferredoxin [Clostridium homopropionicum]